MSADNANIRDAAIDECEEDLCEVDIPFSIVDGSSSDEDEFDHRQNNYNATNDAGKINENAIMDCFNFSVNAHIKGKFDPIITNDNNTKNNESKSKIEAGKEVGKCSNEKEEVQQNSTESTKSSGSWFPAQLTLPKWAASD